MGALVGMVGMVGVLTVPLARVTVLTWLSSPLALLSILAAASAEEKRGGRLGRKRGELEKKRGESGYSRSSIEVVGRGRGRGEEGSSERLGWGNRRALLKRESEVGVRGDVGQSVGGPRFLLLVWGGETCSGSGAEAGAVTKPCSSRRSARVRVRAE